MVLGCRVGFQTSGLGVRACGLDPTCMTMIVSGPIAAGALLLDVANSTRTITSPTRPS